MKTYHLIKKINVNQASEDIPGVIAIADEAEAVAGIEDTKAMTAKKTKAVVLSSSSALYESDQYIAGETILANDSLFVESLPNFAESTLVQNIGDVTGNTRVSFMGFGSGVASNTLKLSLRKFVSPSANLSVRIETVSGGNPTGTLVDANATATVTAASLTTSLVDTTITLAGSITITKGQQVAIVLSQVGDVVNSTNYYGVGFVDRNSTTRRSKVWNGSTWSSVSYSNANNVANQGSGNGFTTLTTSYSVTAINDVLLVSQSYGSTITGPGVNTSSLTPNIILIKGNTYTITMSGYGFRYYWGSYSSTDFTLASSAYSILGTHTLVTQRISTIYPYTSSTLFENRVLSKTNADYTYKLPTDYVRLATQGYSVGQLVTSKYYGLHTYSGLADNTIYYIANIPGAISAIAGIHTYPVGKTSIGTINISDIKLESFSFTELNASVGPGTITTNPYFVIKDQIIGISLSTSQVDTSNIARLEISSDGSNWSTLINRDSIGTTTYNSLLLKKGFYYRTFVTAVTSGPQGSASVSITNNYSIYL